MDWFIYPIVILVGFIAGFINTLAGSGSLLTLPVLIMLGLPPNVANGANRIAILFQNIVAVSNFKLFKTFEWKEAALPTFIALVGSIIGAMFAVSINEKAMNISIGFLLIIMFGLLLFKPELWIRKHEFNTEKPFKWIQGIVLFTVGIYGGFIQAGVGLFLLAGLVLGCGMNLVKANALKNTIVLVYTPFALAVFILNDQVNYYWGGILAVGNMAGAYVAGRMAIKQGAEFIRWIMLFAILIAALQLLGVFSWIFDYFK